ncbi:hypothetical protein LTR62_002911 [Meristemomyces frigidus]|uniref:Uncharacterized protein n=1 Tax=Meristemomyces frigidus TaxID=1508187 RepID=A0AAN7TIB8_9PEZI|nr:hypothetical protein LTR62_002911 [Meristemomyces frigidus]
MIHDFDLPGLGLCCGVDQRLAALNRELRFIARTLARLRHRHHAALVFANKQSSVIQSNIITDLQQRVPQQTVQMLKRLFITPHKERPEDIESAPATPTDERPPSLTPCSPSPASISSRVTKERAQSLHLPQTRPTSDYNTTPLPRPASYAATSSAHEETTITLIIDQASQALFDMPRHHIPTILSRFSSKAVPIQPHRENDEATTVEGIYLPGVRVPDLSDFMSWTRTGRILPQTPSPSDPEWQIEHSARRLIAALTLGITLSSLPYQQAFLEEFAALAPLLEWPEDYVTALFTATRLASCASHPAEGLMVAIVAARTVGRGKRGVRKGAGEGGAGERIRSTRFWGMFDSYVEVQGPECSSPGGVNEFVARL